MIEAAKKAQIHDFVSSLPDGYDTYVGERELSCPVGRRAHFNCPGVFKKSTNLILDEATSALDSITEKKFNLL